MNYAHTQKSPLYLVLAGVAAGLLVTAWWFRHEPLVLALNVGLAAMFLVVSFGFRELVVRDEGTALALHFGPIPLFRKRIPYESISHVHRGRSSVVDGWGIHWVPRRGWTWNLWGFDCVEMRVDGRPFRIGTDDAENLTSFLKQKVGEPADEASTAA